jgi:membrane fusion protein (multidrug efflux system)
MKCSFIETLAVQFFLLVLFGTVVSCGSNYAAPGDRQITKAMISDETATTVRTTPVVSKPFEYLIHATGKIHSLHDQLLTSENGGRIVSMNAKGGMIFSTGQLIAQLDATAVLHQLERAELSLFNGQKEYESQLLGYEELLKGKTKQQSDTIRQKIRISSGLAIAEQEIKERQYELGKTSVKAPFMGVLSDIKVQQGELVKPGQELFRIYDPRELMLAVKVLEADLPLIKIGSPAELSPVYDPAVKHKATVFEINPYVDENGLVSIKLKIDKPATKDLFPGMNCSATIKVLFPAIMVMPKEALVMRSGKAVAFVFENGRAKWNFLDIGRDNGKEIEIKSGLKKDQLLIITNNLQLEHDTPVVVQNNESGK